MTLDQIKNFRQWGSHTPGHPERFLEAGIEVTTGPLGQGFANGIGLAIAEAYLSARYNRPGYEIINHYTYAIVSDGDLMEGVAAEAASFAGHLKLGKLIFLYDDNEVTLSAGTQVTFTEDRAQRFESYGWQTILIEDGNDIKAIELAIRAAQMDLRKAKLDSCPDTYRVRFTQTRFLRGPRLSFRKRSYEIDQRTFGWPLEPTFYIPEAAKEHYLKSVEKGKKVEKEWNDRWRAYQEDFPDLAQELKLMMDQKLPEGWNKDIKPFPADPKGMATRVASGKVLNMIAPHLPGLIGGSADLNPSTHTVINHGGTFESPLTDFGDRQGAIDGGWNYAGRNIQFGVREHAMAAISNGIATYEGLIPYCSTFLCFSDYMRPAIRLAALSNKHVLFIFTHDSIGLGEDGPTHQPVEHVASLRAIPQLVVIRPADANETAVAWQVAIETNTKPTAFILTRQNVPTFDRSLYASAEGLRKGAYVLADPQGQKPNIILIATGSEVKLIVEAQQKLAEEKIYARLVSMPSWELFDEQPQEYKDSVLIPEIKARLVVEAGIQQGWERFMGCEGAMIGVNRFGASAPGDLVMKEYGFTVDNVIQKARELMRK